MTILDLLFLGSVLLLLFFLVRTGVLALQGKWSAMYRTVRAIGLYLACYATILIAVALSMPRRFQPPGQRKCFDDWCVAAVTAEIAKPTAAPPCATEMGSRIWIATMEVSSDAKRIRQRARDATADLEDQKGHRYGPCAAPLSAGNDPPRKLSDELGPDESFRVLLPFRVPADTQPAGVVVHHGAFPGIIIIGGDQSFLHPPTLWRIAVVP